MRWLIVGASGQLGLSLQKELKVRGENYSVADSRSLDITNQFATNSMMKLLKPDVIVNAAAWTDVDGAEENADAAYSVNALGPLNLAIAARNIGSLLVQISTDYVFSGEKNSPWIETSDLSPSSVYGFTKSKGEVFALTEYPSSVYVVRTAWLYSAYRRNFAKTMTRLAFFQDEGVSVINDQIGQPTFAGDLAKQIVDLVLSAAPVGIYHGTNSGQSSWFDFAKEIFRLAGANSERIIPVSTRSYGGIANRPSYSVLSHGAWQNTDLPPLREWRSALEDAMPEIISQVQGENR